MKSPPGEEHDHPHPVRFEVSLQLEELDLPQAQLRLGPEFASGGPLSNGAVSTSINMPPQATLGFAYKVSDAWSFMADYQYTVWGWFSDVNIDFANPGTPDLALHPTNKDTHGFRFGTEYQYNSKVQLRGGYLYHTASSPAQFVTPLLPEAPRNEFTLGAGIALSPRWHADLAYQYIKQNDRRGTVNLAQGNTGVYQFSAHLFGAGLSSIKAMMRSVASPISPMWR